MSKVCYPRCKRMVLLRPFFTSLDILLPFNMSRVFNPTFYLSALRMPNNNDFKELAEQHLKTAEILMKARDWSGAAYMLGYVLEFALKAASCKALNFVVYPDSYSGSGSEKVYSFFKAHNFDQLLIVSGLSDLFDTRGSKDAQRNWSDFTGPFLGDWTSMRYNKERRKQFDEDIVRDLHDNLTNKADGILAVIDNNKRW